MGEGCIYRNACRKEGGKGEKFDTPGHTLAKQVSKMQDGGGL